MAINTRAKGRRNELRAKKLLEEAGYEVEITKGSQKFNKSVDFFGLWDLIAINPKTIRFIQVKSNRKASGIDQEAMNLWITPDCCTKEMWVYKDRIKEPFIYYL
jgi:hypothetical protein